ncbi:MAG TPA: YihY/virulence factor BrkB family protein [Bacteroidia bacterium]|nr:YihY/virulence factor BrkB family protein [Bacteroidia bacterium]
MARVKKNLKTTWKLLKETFAAFNEDKVPKLSAALSYYTIFSIAPMLVLIIGLGSIFFGREAIQGEVFGLIVEYVGVEAAAQIQNVLKETSIRHDTVLSTIISGATLLLTATGIFSEIQDSINQIWGLKTKPQKGLIKLVLNRVLSFSMILVLGFVLVVSLVASYLLELSLRKLKALFDDELVDSLVVMDYVLIFAAITVLFMFIFKVLPDAKIGWRYVMRGAVVTSLFFLLGRYLIGFYLKQSATISAYGAAGSLILLLAWVYYSSIILYFGAEFTQVYARHKGMRIEPNKYAVVVEVEVKETRGVM